MPLNDNTRTTVSDVEEIFHTNLETSSLEHHINLAASMVDDVEEVADSSVPDRKFRQIEQYLAAHVASAQDPRVTSSSVGDSSFNYLQPSEVTRYWNLANSLDPTGIIGMDTKQVGIESVNSRYSPSSEKGYQRDG